jgi:hypothetical protein
VLRRWVKCLSQTRGLSQTGSQNTQTTFANPRESPLHFTKTHRILTCAFKTPHHPSLNPPPTGNPQLRQSVHRHTRFIPLHSHPSTSLRIQKPERRRLSLERARQTQAAEPQQRWVFTSNQNPVKRRHQLQEHHRLVWRTALKTVVWFLIIWSLSALIQLFLFK